MKPAEKAISFLPRTILSWIESGNTEHYFPAIVAFADVSGFTAMTERLAGTGKEGAETLTSILNRYFSTMIDRIDKGGGFVGKYGGDAMTIFFPVKSESDLNDTAKRAVTTCLDLQSLMDEFEKLQTKAGVFSLRMKVGIAEGPVLFKVVGSTDKGQEYLLAGNPLDMAAEAEHHGSSGEVVLTSRVAELSGAIGSVLDDGFVVLDETSERPSCESYKSSLHMTGQWSILAKPFIDPSVYHRLQLGLDSVGEIRRVTVIFMSFSGLDYDNDPGVGHKLNEMFEWVQRLIKRYNGVINKIDMGDKGSKLIITFGAPTAHENDATHAVMCGQNLLEVKEELRAWGFDLRLGIATGVVFAGEVGAASRQEYTVMGSAVNLSARLMAHSRPGILLIDPVTHKKTKNHFEFYEAEQVKFKGIDKPLPVFRVKGVKVRERRPSLTDVKPLVGRSSEVERCKKTIEKVDEGSLRVLMLKGDAGTGKSRLRQETVNICMSKGYQVGAGESLSYSSQVPYLPWISIMRGLMGLPPSGGDKKVLQRLKRIVKKTNSDHPHRTPIVAGLLGIRCPDNDITKHFDAKLRQENLFDFMLQYFAWQAEHSPVSIVFEDAQWIDPSSLELTYYLVRNLAKHSVLIILTLRPEYSELVEKHFLRLESVPATEIIQVAEFDSQDAERYTLQQLNANSIGSDLMDFIFDYSHGNAAFIEELLRNLRSDNRIRFRQQDGTEKLHAEKTGDLSDVVVTDACPRAC